MAGLSEQHRAFVLRLMELGPTKRAAAKAAGDVGFHTQHGYVLMRDDRVLAAIREEATKHLAGAALIGVKVMVEIAQDKDHKDRYKAAKDLAAINGFTAEQRIVVEHISPDNKGMIAEIRSMAAQLGLDPKQLISATGFIEDAEFTEVGDESS